MKTMILLVAASAFCVSTLSAAPRDLATLGRLLERASDYDYGKSREALFEIERLLSAFIGKTEQQAAEQKLIAQLPRASPGLREFLCRQLGRIGGDASIEPLVSLLGNPEAASLAVHALAQIPGDAAPRRLREVFGQAPDKQKPGIAWILGERRDAASVPLLSNSLTLPDAELAAAAALALGKIGTADALQSLSNFRVKASGDLKRKILEAQLNCAEALPSQVARGFYADLKDSAEVEPQFRAAGLRGLVLTDVEQAGKLILAALRTKDAALVSMAVSLADRVQDADELKQIAQMLPGLSATDQARLLGSLERAGKPAVLPAVVKAAGDSREVVRMAAIKSLGVLGDGSAVDALAEVAATGSDSVRPVARAILDRLPGAGVNARIVQLMAGAAPNIQAELARAAGARGIADALPALRKAAAATHAGLRNEAVRSLGKIGLPEDEELLARMLLSAPEKELEDALVAIGSRVKVTDAICFETASARDAKGKIAMLSVLARLSDRRGLDMIQAALGSSDWATRTGAVRALAVWPSPLPMDQLWHIAVTDDDVPRHAAALAGYIRMIVEAQNRPVAERIELLGRAVTAARRLEEKRQAITALADIPSVEALRLAMSYFSVEELKPSVRSVVGTISQRYAGADDVHVAEALAAVNDQAPRR